MVRILTILQSPVALLGLLVASLIMTGSTAADNSINRLGAALIPLANNTEIMSASEAVLPTVIDLLTKRGFVLVPSQELRDFMRQRRIRLNGEINSDDAAVIAEQFGVRFLITGAIESYDTLENPEVGLSLRFYDVRSSKMVWANSAWVSNGDFTRWFGMGGERSLSEITVKTCEKLLHNCPDARELNETAESQTVNEPSGARKLRVAVIPFDNQTEFHGVDKIATNALIAVLFDRDCDVIESGEVMALLRRLQSVTHGETNLSTIQQLHDNLGVDLAVTGTVYEAEAEPAGFGESSCSIETGLRLIDARDGQLIASVSKGRRGSDGQSVFGLGRTYSLGQLTQDCLADAWHELFKQGEKRLAAR